MVGFRTVALGLGAYIAFRTFFGGNPSGGGKGGKGSKGGDMANFVTYRVDPAEPFGPRWKTQRPPGLPLDAREASAEGEGERWVRQIADQQGLGPAFTGAILSLAHNESGGTFIIGLPANNFDTRPSSERPRVERGSRYDQYPRDTGGDGIQDVITAWGLFQFNKGAWQRLSRERRGDVDPDLASPVAPRTANQNPWDATSWEELAYPILWYARIFEQAKRLGAPDLAAARAIRVYHSGPAYWQRYADIGESTGDWERAWRESYSADRAARVAQQFTLYGVR